MRITRILDLLSVAAILFGLFLWSFYPRIVALEIVSNREARYYMLSDGLTIVASK